RVQQAKAVPGVASAQPLYIRYAPFVWKNREHAGGILEWPIRVIAVEPDQQFPAFRHDRMPGFEASQSLLTQPHSVLLDERSKTRYDVTRQWRAGGPSPVGAEREVGGQTVRIVGLFGLGTDFSVDGNMMMSARTLAEFIPGRDALDSVQLGLVKLDPGANAS